VALDTQDEVLFARVFKVAEFNEFIETLIPHLGALDLEFRNNVLTQVAERIPKTCKWGLT
jgi:hypothetical protein